MGLDNDTRAPHYSGKREPERLVTAGPVPWSIVRGTQFHDFAAMVAGWTEHEGTATIAPLLVQPIALTDVAAVLAEVAPGTPLRATIDIAGPETQDLVDMARRTYAARGQAIRLIPTWRGVFGPHMAGEVLLPGENARLGPTTFDQWLAAGAKLRRKPINTLRNGCVAPPRRPAVAWPPKGAWGDKAEQATVHYCLD